MIKSLRRLAIASLLLPVCLPLAAANGGLSNKVQQSLKANKISSQSLSVVTVPLNGPGSSTYFNADISVNPASTMKLVTRTRHWNCWAQPINGKLNFLLTANLTMAC